MDRVQDSVTANNASTQGKSISLSQIFVSFSVYHWCGNLRTRLFCASGPSKLHARHKSSFVQELSTYLASKFQLCRCLHGNTHTPLIANKINLTIFFSTCRECNPATAAPAVHAVARAETSTSTAAKQNSPKNPTGAKQNPTRNGNAFLTKQNPTLSKRKLPESCTILQVHRTGQLVWVLLDSKAHYWLRKSGVLWHD